MQTITITFIPEVQPHELEHALEEFTLQASERKYKIKVRHQGEDDEGHNLYTMESETPHGFYYAGIVMAKLVDQLLDRQ